MSSRVADLCPEEALLLGLQLFERYRDRMEVEIVHRQWPMPIQYIDMILGYGFVRQTFGNQPVQKLLG
ncbi:hypothetical protein XH91_35250 (plasmid) [Bradyrhizobium guangzhouense]|uniref:Uncharacterized protein n=1 Tax=Bradyrhizobium guangzhouense TaxID=1325095 RepID=A0AAE5X8L7_9BRAD|nr:hypothetical protein XH91_35250 [Bradyrhizobium guangzhouense]